MRKRICRLIENIIRNKKNVTFNDLDKLLKEFGYECKQPKSGGSHYIYRKNGVSSISVPKKRPYVKEYYVKQIIGMLELEVIYEEEC